jgi:uncharacterized membrane protein YidH (DUF202 family)
MSTDEKVVHISEWIVTLLVLSVPVVNLVAALYWAFSKKETRPESKRTYAKAYLIIQAVIFALVMLFVGLMLAAGEAS